MEEAFQDLCQNSTSENDLESCLNQNMTGTNETTDDQYNVESTYNFYIEIKYYCEGVILVPLAIFGLFGKCANLYIVAFGYRWMKSRYSLPFESF